MLGAGRHPMQLMYTLQGHYGNLLKLDGARTATQPRRRRRDRADRRASPPKKTFELSRKLRSDQVKTSCCWARPTSTCAARRRGPRTWS
ncbi:MAG: hypothetical protein U5R31_00410 [Acidimicrobiia bacterium]|nr:hypothetical protein [Acidimicrobiia bacterium]